ncbi:MAG: hypothetical protein LBT54_01275 [Bifidobacteriaceae bacterium]|jgi:antitoxin (DNA-binding transcriptional repressor) of toxin-antitoxin stability system|nr:hypothetical protein [Bifidobacteriaceae bacterium]
MARSRADSRLLAQAERGEQVVIARNGTAIATLQAITPPSQREFGFMDFDVPEEFFDPMTEAELREWGM